MKGRIIQSNGSWYEVLMSNEETWKCRLKGNFRIKGLKTTNPLAVGDIVGVKEEDNPGYGVIHELEPRHNYIIRQSPRNARKHHIIAANLDQSLLVVSVAKPRTSTGFIDRFLLSAELYHIPSILVINKRDLYNEKEMAIAEEWLETYRSIGYTCFFISGLDDNLDEIKSALQGKISLLAGHSGAGKTTIINRIYPNLDLRTGEISSSSGKGMHTTTFATMFPLGGETFLVDTPGIKEFDFADLKPEEIGHYFPEFTGPMQDCKFDNCLHQNEPKCAVKVAVEKGEIAATRFRNYSNILADRQTKNSWE